MTKDNSEQGTIPTHIAPVSWRSPLHYYVGCDLGQANDPTAIAVVEACEEVRMPADPALYVYRCGTCSDCPSACLTPTW